jgi:hypothetical protein
MDPEQDPDLYPDLDSLKMLDPDPQHWRHGCTVQLYIPVLMMKRGTWYFR